MAIQKNLFIVICMLSVSSVFAQNYLDVDVRLGLNFPQSGPYAKEGADQWRAANIAIDEINAEGGIHGRKARLAWRDSRSRKDVTAKNVTELIDVEGVKMVFGGASSDIAIEAGRICQEKKIPFFTTLGYSTTITGQEGHRYVFRECNDSLMSAKALSFYLNEKYAGKKYFYITADYSWGNSTEEAMRTHSGTKNRDKHKGVKVSFPDIDEDELRASLSSARASESDILVLVLFGKHMQEAVKLADEMGIKESMQLIVPNLTLWMVEGAEHGIMDGVVGTVPWCWNVPYQYDYPLGRRFVETFFENYGVCPSSSAASAYTVVYEYKSAVERAGSFDSAQVVSAFEAADRRFLVIDPIIGHEYTMLKDRQIWRDFDHQSLQTVYVVECKSPAKNAVGLEVYDYFKILSSLSGDQTAISFQEWKAARKAAGKPPKLEDLD